ncbi:MAG: hypothetical protein R2758_03165 [Bacteroidales bacterium]
MKTKVILTIICLLMGTALRPMPMVRAMIPNLFSTGMFTECMHPVFCDDVMVDYLSGEVMFHVIDHYKDGVWQWEIAQAKGEAAGMYGEVFKVREVDKYWIPVYGVLVWHYNLIGDMGHHYIGTLSYSYITGEMQILKTVCK